VNGNLGHLLKKHFLGMVKLSGDKNEEEPANTWRHYKAAKVDGLGVSFAQLVKDNYLVYLAYENYVT
jgi:hypothetical protein